MRIYMHEEVEQGSARWMELHRGIATASEFFKVMAKVGPKGGTSHKEYQQRATYMRVLAAEILTGELREPEWFGNRHTLRGSDREEEARLRYAMEVDPDIKRVGFVENFGVGCSPDCFVGEYGGVEIKDCLGHRQIERLQAGVVPPEHKWQVVGSLYVTGRSWWDFVSHCRGLPLFTKRTTVDEAKEDLVALAAGIETFRAELARLVDWIEAMR